MCVTLDDEILIGFNDLYFDCTIENVSRPCCVYLFRIYFTYCILRLLDEGCVDLSVM